MERHDIEIKLANQSTFRHSFDMMNKMKTAFGILCFVAGLCLTTFSANAAEDPYAVNPIGCGTKADLKIEKILIKSTSIDCIVESIDTKTMRVILHKSHVEEHADKFVEKIKNSIVLKHLKDNGYTDLKIYYNDSHVKILPVRKL
ncbi:MAG: hypothetical protein EAZ65_07210 [Verrucomicrobia bacterium]|nr:MAG: hypothetical protein EAZ84_09455 [Verrucomicrobiota bacterium]TAE87393.1 MAG: hypothetical protein EAZ82_08190 [Verrucomicrobiota bacterium]TAF25247.1 MAG: hypothetical protein EAZ71_08415 [Verrucomicrobiota bacterium]TAF40894.1 MAG: hypothetical protein EAZ65_07210 [Verrucomicrobiota bacterium]